MLGQTPSSAAFDFKVEQAASVRLVPASVALVPVLLPGEQTPWGGQGQRGGCSLQAAGGEICPAVAHVADIPSWTSPDRASFGPVGGMAVCWPSLHGLGTELKQTWPFSA